MEPLLQESLGLPLEKLSPIAHCIWKQLCHYFFHKICSTCAFVMWMLLSWHRAFSRYASITHFHDQESPAPVCCGIDTGNPLPDQTHSKEPEARTWCGEIQYNCPEVWWSCRQLKTWAFPFKSRFTVPALATANTILSHKRLCLDCNKSSTYILCEWLLCILLYSRSWWLLGKHRCAGDGGLNKPAGEAIYWRLFERCQVYGWRGLFSKAAVLDLKC